MLILHFAGPRRHRPDALGERHVPGGRVLPEGESPQAGEERVQPAGPHESDQQRTES